VTRIECACERLERQMSQAWNDDPYGSVPGKSWGKWTIDLQPWWFYGDLMGFNEI
jgi:hypothetical protein